MSAVRKHTRATWGASADAAELLNDAFVAGVSPLSMVRAMAACARLALPRVSAHEDRPRRALEVAEAWGTGASSGGLDAWRAREAVRTCYLTTGNAGAAYAALIVVTFAHEHGRAGVSAAVTSVASAALKAAVGAVGRSDPTSLEFCGAVEREVFRRSAPLVRARVPWATLAAAYRANERRR